MGRNGQHSEVDGDANLVIRAARADEVELVVALRERAFASAAPAVYSKQEVENLLGDVDRAELESMVELGQLFVGVEGAAVLASGGWREDRLRHIYVEPECHGRGFGKRMVAHAEDDYVQRTENRVVELGCGLYAEGFYERCGYVTVERRRSWDGSAMLWMRKTFA